MSKLARLLHVVRGDDIRQLLWVDEDGNHLVTSSTSEKGETRSDIARIGDIIIYDPVAGWGVMDADMFAQTHESMELENGF